MTVAVMLVATILTSVFSWTIYFDSLSNAEPTMMVENPARVSLTVIKGYFGGGQKLPEVVATGATVGIEVVSPLKGGK